MSCICQLLRFADVLNQDDGRARRLNIWFAVGIGLLAKGMPFGFDTTCRPIRPRRLLFQDRMNSVIWLCLFALLGVSRWMLNSYTIIGVSTARTVVTVRLFCLPRPFYSLPVVASARSILAANSAC